MRRAMLAALTALVIGSSGSASAAGGGYRGDWEIGGYGGYGWLDEYGTLLPKNDLLYGVRLGFFFSDHWSIEGSWQRLPTERDTIVDTGIEFSGLRGNLLYNFAPGMPVRPFITGGLGYETVDVEGFGDKTSELGWNLGAGIRFFLSRNWCLRVDGRWMQTHSDIGDETQDNQEASVGLSVLFGPGGGDAEVAEVRPVNQPPSVTCTAERAEILPGETVRITATASDPEGDPLTYVWATNTGRVLGPSNTATLDFTGVNPPSGATVRVTVSDGRGNVVTCETAVRLLEPVRPAEAVSCLAGGFPRNLSRLNNVDKACLDDVVTRLKADPRARVVVVGHADSRETNPTRVGDQRATAVRDYLVQAGIETSRVETRSVGDTRMMASDAASAAGNRRVEVWFVPEGATVPE